jgi:hypothetical protein
MLWVLIAVYVFAVGANGIVAATLSLHCCLPVVLNTTLFHDFLFGNGMLVHSL